MTNQSLVSVCMITYGHEEFIQQSIESVLMQQTKFNFELIIANDCSPDTTDVTVKNILQNHQKGDVIKYFSHSKNKGMYDNFLFALQQCKSKYIALCEGDDYWTDPLKLQKQVDFLEANPSYEVCFTNIRVVNENNTITKQALITDNRKTDYVQKDLPIWAPTLTRVFKNRDFMTIPSAPGLDTIMLLWQSHFGKIKFINEITGSYRKHEGGIYSSLTQAKKIESIILTFFESLKIIDTNLFPKYFGMIFKKLVELKELDYQIYTKNKTIFLDLIDKNKGEFSFLGKVKVHFGVILLSTPLVTKSKGYKKFILKVFSKLFLY